MKTEIATLAGGCFWCTEAIFKRLKGVITVTSGYTGGERENPTYAQVSTGETGHAEAIQIAFDPDIISYKKILNIFWNLHNPTTLNQQGADIGSQYRSAIYYHSEKQKKESHESLKDLQNFGEYTEPIVTEIKPIQNFYTAEDYHQNYFDNNPSLPYCNLVINPKINKLIEMFNDEVKEEYK